MFNSLIDVLRKRATVWKSVSLIIVMTLNIWGCQEFLQKVKKTPDSLNSNNAGPPAPDSAYSFNASIDPQASAIANGPFGGISIIEMREDPNWERGARYLVIFVSPEGNYAAVADWLRYEAGCIAWVIGHSPDFSALTFGGIASPKPSNPNVVNRSICPQFTIRMHDDKTVKLTRGSYEVNGNILARVPLQNANWSRQIFDQLAIRGIRLGPVSPTRPYVPPFRKSFELSSFKDRFLTEFSATVPPDSMDRKSGYVKPVFGYYSARDITGWPTDVRLLTWHTGTLAQGKTPSEFDQVLLAQYGAPSFKRDSFSYWVYDLQGNKISEKDASPQNCLGSFDLSLRIEPNEFGNKPFRDVLGRDDLGPWGCSLVVRVASGRVTVSSYQIDSVAGFALGQAVFKARLAEVKRYR